MDGKLTRRAPRTERQAHRVQPAEGRVPIAAGRLSQLADRPAVFCNVCASPWPSIRSTARHQVQKHGWRKAALAGAAILLPLMVGPLSEAAAPTVSPASVTFARTVGGPNPPAQTVQVTVAPAQAWKICDGMPWADTSMPGGSGASCPAGQGGWQRTGAGSITVTPNATMAGLAAGTYQETITLTAGPDVVPITVTVTVSAGARPSGGATGLGISFLADPVAGQPVTVLWNAATAYTDGSPLANPTYLVERSEPPGAYQERVRDIAALTWTDGAVITGRQYCYRAFTRDPAGLQSAPSNEACTTAEVP